MYVNIEAYASELRLLNQIALELLRAVVYRSTHCCGHSTSTTGLASDVNFVCAYREPACLGACAHHPTQVNTVNANSEAQFLDVLHYLVQFTAQHLPPWHPTRTR